MIRQPDALPEWRQIDRGVSSALILTECLRTLDRLRIRANLPDTEVAMRRAAQPTPTEPGTLDAIHIATALLWKESTRAELVMATPDFALALAARAHGLAVADLSASSLCYHRSCSRESWA